MDTLQFAYRWNWLMDNTVAVYYFLCIIIPAEFITMLMHIEHKVVYNSGHISSTTSLNTGSPQGCDLNPSSTDKHSLNIISRLLMPTSSCESPRTEMRQHTEMRSECCNDNILCIKISIKILRWWWWSWTRWGCRRIFKLLWKEAKDSSIKGLGVFLGVHLTCDLNWSLNTKTVLINSSESLVSPLPNPNELLQMH